MGIFFSQKILQSFLEVHGYALQKMGYSKEVDLKREAITINPKQERFNLINNSVKNQSKIMFTSETCRLSNNYLIINNILNNLNKGQNKEALNQFNKIEPHKNTAEINYGKAVALARIGNHEEAVELLDQLLINNPNHRKSKQLLNELSHPSIKQIESMLEAALTCFKEGNKIEALRLAEKAASFGLFVPGMHYLRSVFSSATARYEEALEAAKQELEHNPSHIEANRVVQSLSKAITRDKKNKIPTEERKWNTSLPHHLIMSIQNAHHNYSYRGILVQKNPFDLAIYPLLLWNVKPRTIIEIGSKSGGSAVWLGDLLKNFQIDGHIYSLDIIKVTQVSHEKVTFLEGNGQALHESFSEEFFQSIPRPLLVIDDADHSYQTSKSILNFFHPYLMKREYIVIEDGMISDIVQDSSYSSGPHLALKEFLAEHSEEYEIDGEYCDFFGYNITWATNGYLQKKTEANITFLHK